MRDDPVFFLLRQMNAGFQISSSPFVSKHASKQEMYGNQMSCSWARARPPSPWILSWTETPFEGKNPASEGDFSKYLPGVTAGEEQIGVRIRHDDTRVVSVQNFKLITRKSTKTRCRMTHLSLRLCCDFQDSVLAPACCFLSQFTETIP